MKTFVTGGAGFLGSLLVERLLAAGHSVTIYDNFSTGREAFISTVTAHPLCRVVRGDILNASDLERSVAGHDVVFHLAANADVHFGLVHPQKDLEQNTLGTFRVLEAMRAAGVNRLAFASTGAIYGEPCVFPTPETCPFPEQTSLYGASKLAAEGLITAYAAGFGFQVFIFRLVSLLGERYHHGHVIDFVRKLRADRTEVEVLGDGRQRKSYLYVGDCVDAMLAAVGKAQEKVNIFNVGSDEWCTVDQSLDWICEWLAVSPRRRYAGGARGWVGDSPFIFLDTARITSLGWRPSLSIRQAVHRTLIYLSENSWLLEERPACA